MKLKLNRWKIKGTFAQFPLNIVNKRKKSTPDIHGKWFSIYEDVFYNNCLATWEDNRR